MVNRLLYALLWEYIELLISSVISWGNDRFRGIKTLPPDPGAGLEVNPVSVYAATG